MNSNDQSHKTLPEHQDELAWRRMMQNMPKEIQAKHDLWHSIETQLSPQPMENSNKSQWKNWALAATFLVTILTTSGMFYFMQQPQTLQQVVVQTSILESFNDIDKQHDAVKASLTPAYESQLQQLQTGTAQTIRHNMMIIAKAKKSIRSALQQQPYNNDLSILLMQTYEQELALMQEIATTQSLFKHEF